MLAIIRIRGVGARREIADTLKMLRLKAPNNCIVVQETADYKGMAQKARDSITYGEIEKDVLVSMLQKRLRAGSDRVDEKMLKAVTGYESFVKFAEALLANKVKIKDFEKLNPVFRLTPPSKGFKSVREHYPAGDLGYRGKEINELLKRMI